MAEACEELRQRPVSGTDPSQAWLRIKDVRMLKPRARGVARAVSEWRERRAMSVDVPVRQILPDLAVLGIAQRQPKTTHDLVQARGVEERHSKGNLGKEILDAVADGQRNDIDLPAPDGEDLDRACDRPWRWCRRGWPIWPASSGSTPACWPLGPTWWLCCAATTTLDCCTGWRAELVGDDIQRLVQGKAGLTFDGRGGLRLIDVADDDVRLAQARSAPRRFAQLRPQLVEGVADVGGTGAVGVDRAALADRLVDDHPLRHRRLPDRLAPDDPGRARRSADRPRR